MPLLRLRLPLLSLAAVALLAACQNGNFDPILPSPSPGSGGSSPGAAGASITVDGHTAPVSVADTADLRASWPKVWPNGPAANSGILLDWGGGSVQKIWFYSVPVPLDVVFVANGKVVELDPNEQPCPTQTNCNTFGPDVPIDYLVELPAGTAAAWSLRVGDAISYTHATGSPSPGTGATLITPGPDATLITPGPSASLITPAPASTPAATPSPTSTSAPVSSGGNPFVGSWIGIAGTIGQLTINADGTYSDNRTPQGRYTVNGNQITFLAGTMTTWNHGNADLDKYGNLEFYWSDDAGTHYFVFERQ